MAFDILETSIEAIHSAYKSGELTCRQLVQMYLDRIEAYDRKGPSLNAIITLNSKALEEADHLDAAFKKSGLTGPLHGIPVVVKDQADAAGMPTTLGSLVFKDYYPGQDCFVVENLKKAGAIILGKTTLGELGGGDTHGSLFGSTRNPYDPERTVGGSSGGSAACVSANFSTVAVAQEGLASIRRPSTWNSIAGMRPTAGLVSRGGVYGGWPSVNGSLGPMARNVTDLAKLLDVMAGYDPEDPLTARGIGHLPDSFTKFLDQNALKGARLGILRESMGLGSEPTSEDYKMIDEVFERAVGELKSCRRSHRRSDCHSKPERSARQTGGELHRRRGIVQQIFFEEHKAALQITRGGRRLAGLQQGCQALKGALQPFAGRQGALRVSQSAR